jgi:hypothetical protein
MTEANKCVIRRIYKEILNEGKRLFPASTSCALRTATWSSTGARSLHLDCLVVRREIAT